MSNPTIVAPTPPRAPQFPTQLAPSPNNKFFNILLLMTPHNTPLIGFRGVMSTSDQGKCWASLHFLTSQS